jgi:hypothetical protein
MLFEKAPLLRKAPATVKRGGAGTDGTFGNETCKAAPCHFLKGSTNILRYRERGEIVKSEEPDK